MIAVAVTGVLLAPATVTLAGPSPQRTVRVRHAPGEPNGRSSQPSLSGDARSGRPVSRASAEVYDPTHNRWSAAGNMRDERAFHTAPLLPRGAVLVAGGFADKGTLRGAGLLDPATGHWRRTGSLRQARGHAAAALVGGDVLVVGGERVPGRIVASAELYDGPPPPPAPAAS